MDKETAENFSETKQGLLHVYSFCSITHYPLQDVITLRMGDADLRFYITTVQDG